MKPFLLLLLSLLFFSCAKTPEKEKNTVVKQQEEKIDLVTKELKDYPLFIQELIVTEEGVFRGIDFGLNEENIRSIEKAKFIQSDNDKHILLAEQAISDDINLDVEYLFTAHQLAVISCVIYTNNNKQQDSCYAQLQGYLANKFKLDTTQTDWVITNSLVLSLKKAGNQHKASDIELVFKKK